jgi:two-component system, LytTR family, sensor kinase
LGWILFFSLVFGFAGTSTEMLTQPGLLLPRFLLFTVVYVGLFYLNTGVLMPRLYFQKKFLLYTSVILLLLAGVFWVKPYDRILRLHMRPGREERTPHFHRMPPPDHQRPTRFSRDEGPMRLDIVSVVLFLAVWSFSTALQVNRQLRSTERRALQAERDKTSAELSFLKAQINPHFLFNTLNNIYSLSILKSEQTPNAILKLSDILHYITDEVQNDLVPLKSEVDCVKNYIELQQLRLTDKVDVRLNVRGEIAGKQLAPLLFMTFIENAFKYGISSHERCTIDIEIAAEERSVAFSCRNKILVKNATEERTGIGISNAKKRLDHLYPGKHSLNIYTEEDHFIVYLEITG